MDEGELAGRRSAGTVATWCGAGLSLALLAGLAGWSWQLLVRDVSGVPVIKAAVGPMRVAPDEPGGARAAHQGLAVNSIAAREGEAEPAAAVRLAPGAAELAPEDLPVVAQEPEETAPAMRATDLAVAEALGLDAGQIVAAAFAALRPAPRPASRPAPGAVAAARGEVVQLGAFPTSELAETEWKRLSERFADVLDGTAPRLERVERGGRTIWRLRAVGFEDLADARRVCSALNAGQADCIPVVRR